MCVWRATYYCSYGMVVGSYPCYFEIKYDEFFFLHACTIGRISMCMISIDIYCIILYVHTWFLLFCHCTSYWWTTHFLEHTTRPQQNQREKKNGKKKRVTCPCDCPSAWDDLRSNQTSKVHAKVPPMPGSREVPCHLFPSEGFSRFVLDFFSWRSMSHF